MCKKMWSCNGRGHKGGERDSEVSVLSRYRKVCRGGSIRLCHQFACLNQADCLSGCIVSYQTRWASGLGATVHVLCAGNVVDYRTIGSCKWNRYFLSSLFRLYVYLLYYVLFLGIFKDLITGILLLVFYRFTVHSGIHTLHSPKYSHLLKLWLKFTLKLRGFYMFRSTTIIRELAIEPG